MKIKRQTTNGFVGFDLGSHSLKVIESSFQDGQIIPGKMISVPIPVNLDRSNLESIGNWIADIWNQEQIKSRNIRIALPRHQVLLTEMELPPGEESETKQMVEIRIERELPVPLDSVITDYYPVLQQDLMNQKVVVVSCKKEIIEYYRKLIHIAGLYLDRIDLGTLALGRSIQKAGLSKDSLIVINIGHTNTEILIQEKNNVVFSRSFSMGAGGSLQNTLTNPEKKLDHRFNDSNSSKSEKTEWLTRWVFELKRSLEGYTVESGKPYPIHIYVTGGGHLVHGLIDAIKTKLGDSIQFPNLTDKFTGIPNTNEKNIHQLLTAYGMILSGGQFAQQCDFLHSKLFLKEPHRFSLRFRQLVLGLGTGIFIVALLLGGLFYKEKELSRLQGEYFKFRPLVAQSEQIMANTVLIRSWKSEGINTLELFHELSDFWTNEAILQVFTYDRGKDIGLSGMAKSNQAVANLINKLTESNRFASIKFTYLRASKQNSSYPIEFGLAINYKSGNSKPETKLVLEKP